MLLSKNATKRNSPFFFHYCCFYISLSSFSFSHHSHHLYFIILHHRATLSFPSSCNSIISIIVQLYHFHHSTPSFPSSYSSSFRFPRHTFSMLLSSYHLTDSPSSPQYHLKVLL